MPDSAESVRVEDLSTHACRLGEYLRILLMRHGCNDVCCTKARQVLAEWDAQFDGSGDD